MNEELLPEKIRALERPDRALWRYYVLQAIFSGPLIIFTLPYLYFRFHTLRYRFDDEGIHMKVGLLFRREINLTYARIQDIHLRSGVIQRWFGLANVEIQTASGSSGAELVVEGFKEYEFIRDFLYRRMRGFQSPGGRTTAVPAATAVAKSGNSLEAAFQGAGSDELISLLRGIHEELRKTREIVQNQAGGSRKDNV
jgi:putative membrane protein